MSIPKDDFATETTSNTSVIGQSGTHWNPPFHPHALSLPMITAGKKLRRGSIYQDRRDPIVKSNPRPGMPMGLRFLYNPTDIDASYQISTNITPPQGGEGDAYSLPIIGVPGSAAVRFNLILDRTFDVNDTRSKTYRTGIRQDIAHFERMLGYTKERPFIQPVTMHVVFGNPLLHFFGYISSFSVLYSQWTYDMRPYRGALSIGTFQVLSSDVFNANAKTADNDSTGISTHLGRESASTGTDEESDGRNGAAPTPTPAPAPTP
jgi:hypothetical protein